MRCKNCGKTIVGKSVFHKAVVNVKDTAGTRAREVKFSNCEACEKQIAFNQEQSRLRAEQELEDLRKRLGL